MSGICKKCYRAGYKDEQIGQPCESCKDGTIERDPPFPELVDTLPEEFMCRRRDESFIGSSFPGPDHWNKFKSNGDRVCSYCGSLHWEDMLRLVHEAAIAPEDADYRSTVSIEPSDKSYKVYVHQPGVHNAMEGGIKFYMQHVPRDENGKIAVTEEQQAEYSAAVKASNKRFGKYLNETYPGRKTN
jgi:hypothetical protein